MLRQRHYPSGKRLYTDRLHTHIAPPGGLRRCCTTCAHRCSLVCGSHRRTPTAGHPLRLRDELVGARFKQQRLGLVRQKYCDSELAYAEAGCGDQTSKDSAATQQQTSHDNALRHPRCRRSRRQATLLGSQRVCAGAQPHGQDALPVVRTLASNGRARRVAITAEKQTAGIRTRNRSRSNRKPLW